ncbi:MAG: hypothetical protein A3G38_03950 [Omnitrophica WOR_2 bacterium RIFCSPLOWO2_12_FULL_51_8]|nr:MAG: hypothetical protein A3G38_03950 [Omnitrophica WOR_2 bacterium RIFCSPLOWO2_12_FULL_51_8]
MQDIKLIIFDLDGTLVDAYAAIISSFNYTLQKLGYAAQSAAVIRRAVGWGDTNLLRPFISKKDLPKAMSLYRRHHRYSLVKQSRLFPKVKGLLAYLKSKGYRMAVASNRPTQFSRILLDCLGLDKYFSYLLCADKLKRGKPHPEILKRIIDKFALAAGQAIYVGDMVIDAQAGRRAGIRTIVVTTGSSARKEIKKEKPGRIIKSIGELRKIL